MMLSLALATIALALGIVGVILALLSLLRKADRSNRAAMAEYEYWDRDAIKRERTKDR